MKLQTSAATPRRREIARDRSIEREGVKEWQYTCAGQKKFGGGKNRAKGNTAGSKQSTLYCCKPATFAAQVGLEA